jgi:hypothetical protein
MPGGHWLADTGRTGACAGRWERLLVDVGGRDGEGVSSVGDMDTAREMWAMCRWVASCLLFLWIVMSQFFHPGSSPLTQPLSQLPPSFLVPSPAASVAGGGHADSPRCWPGRAAGHGLPGRPMTRFHQNALTARCLNRNAAAYLLELGHGRVWTGTALSARAAPTTSLKHCLTGALRWLGLVLPALLRGRGPFGFKSAQFRLGTGRAVQHMFSARSED